jgi:hypothetical protein
MTHDVWVYEGGYEKVYSFGIALISVWILLCFSFISLFFLAAYAGANCNIDHINDNRLFMQVKPFIE